MKRHQLVDRLRASFPGEDNHGFNAFDLLHKFGRPLSALLYTELFWPEFREFEGMVFLADSVEDVGDEARVREALDTYRDRTQVEKSFNFVEVPSLFGRSAGETSDEEDELLASRLRDMWSARLRQRFPEREFEVQVEPATDSEEIGVVFFER